MILRRNASTSLEANVLVICMCVFVYVCVLEHQIGILTIEIPQYIVRYIARYLYRLIPPLEDSFVVSSDTKCINFKCLVI